jgi:hypothetical protein
MLRWGQCAPSAQGRLRGAFKGGYGSRDRRPEHWAIIRRLRTRYDRHIEFVDLLTEARIDWFTSNRLRNHHAKLLHSLLRTSAPS